MLLTRQTGREENSSIHVAGVIKMIEASLRLRKSRGTATADPGSGRSVERSATSDGVE